MCTVELSAQGYSSRVFVWETMQECCIPLICVCGEGLGRIPLDLPFPKTPIYGVMLWDDAMSVYSFSSNYYCNNYYYLVHLSCHSVAAVLTPVQTKQIINIHKRNNTKITVQTIQNTDFFQVTKLTLWLRNFLLNFSTLCISNVNNTGTKKGSIMK